MGWITFNWVDLFLECSGYIVLLNLFRVVWLWDGEKLVISKTCLGEVSRNNVFGFFTKWGRSCQDVLLYSFYIYTCAFYDNIVSWSFRPCVLNDVAKRTKDIFILYLVILMCLLPRHTSVL